MALNHAQSSFTGVGERPQGLRELSAFEEDVVSVPSTRVVDHNCLQLPLPRHPITPFYHCRHKACMGTYVLGGKHSSTWKIKSNFTCLPPCFLSLCPLLSPHICNICWTKNYSLMDHPFSYLIFFINNLQIIKKFSISSWRNFVYIVI